MKNKNPNYSKIQKNKAKAILAKVINGLTVLTILLALGAAALNFIPRLKVSAVNTDVQNNGISLDDNTVSQEDETLEKDELRDKPAPSDRISPSEKRAKIAQVVSEKPKTKPVIIIILSLFMLVLIIFPFSKNAKKD